MAKLEAVVSQPVAEVFCLDTPEASEVQEGSIPLALSNDVFEWEPGEPVDKAGALVAFSSVIGRLTSLEALERVLARSLFRLTAADHAVAVFAFDEPRYTKAWTLDRRLGQIRGRASLREVEESILRPVLGPGSPFEGRMQTGVQDIGGHERCAVVEMTVVGRRCGALYYDGRREETDFSKSAVEAITALGSIAALACRSLREIAWCNAPQELPAKVAPVRHGLIGQSPGIRAVEQFIARVAETESTVLILGESGTGKELVARAIHENSRRAGRPFAAINCAALTETLLESELFGYEKGAFTGALSQRRGKLEAAEGGTVFLDEAGEISPALQAKLLRVLQEREFERVGGTRTQKLDIRLIAATNRDLRDAIRRGAFRQDLYYRLNVLSITLPPLRNRREDIPLLAAHFAGKHGALHKRRVRGISPEARAMLMAGDWPGNVRELENAIERAIVLGAADLILPGDLLELTDDSSGRSRMPLLADGVRDAKRRMILTALEVTGGNHADAAKMLGIHANHLSRLITSLNLRSKRRLGLAC